MDNKQIIFNVGNEEYGIDILRVHEIENMSNVVRIPNAPNCILGIMHLRGEVIPVYSLREHFNISDDVKKSSGEEDDVDKLVIVSVDNVKIGFLVDKVKEIIELQDSDIHNTPKIVKNEDTSYIAKVACIQGKIIVLLNVDTIIKRDDLNDISDMLDSVSE